MKLGIVSETRPEERRVAASPAVVGKWVKSGWEVAVERGAGASASYPDAQYEAAGAVIVDRQAAWQSDIVLKLRPPVVDGAACEADQMREGATLISYIQPAESAELVERLAARKLTVLAMDQVPRISRAQKMDALSSMANIAGYRSVVEAANRFGSFFTGQFTAAGKVPPAKVLIIGGGVAGLSALGAAKGLGAIVRAFDVRPSVEDQVKSLGGEFLTVTIQESGEGQGGYAKEMSKEFIDAEYALFRAQAREVDIVITTALIPGKPAPKLWLADMVELMKPGSVIVDLAAESGGNCELTSPGADVVRHGVTIRGPLNLAATMPVHASQMYARNVGALLSLLIVDGALKLDFSDEITSGTCLTHAGRRMDVPAPAGGAASAAPPANPVGARA
jgi:NAD(P) transhydrogenase subunit alpha